MSRDSDIRTCKPCCFEIYPQIWWVEYLDAVNVADLNKMRSLTLEIRKKFRLVPSNPVCVVKSMKTSLSDPME